MKKKVRLRMKLVIDIDEDYVKIINKNGASNYPEEVIKNGIPLDKIRAEILNFKEKCNASDYLGCGILEIIDKYKGESRNGNSN